MRRRVLSSFVCFAFALSLHASIPGSSAAKFSQRSLGSSLVLPVHSPEKLPLTAAPADRQSFYVEFYGTEQLPAHAERKPGLLRRFTTVVKRTAQKVNLIPN
jgi:hypothetical protein